MDGEDERHAGRQRERRGRRAQTTSTPAQQPVEARAARDGGGAEQHAAGQRVTDEPDARRGGASGSRPGTNATHSSSGYAAASAPSSARV